MKNQNLNFLNIFPEKRTGRRIDIISDDKEKEDDQKDTVDLDIEADVSVFFVLQY